MAADQHKDRFNIELIRNLNEFLNDQDSHLSLQVELYLALKII